MTPRPLRLALWFVALLVSAPLFIRGRGFIPRDETAPFFHAGRRFVTVRLKGDFPRPGLYRLPPGATPAVVINMTVPRLSLSPLLRGRAGTRLQSGDVVVLRVAEGQVGDFSLERMPGKEMMLLGIPLDPDRMGVQDWDALPGIGPVLAARIVAYRQRNGGFGSLEGVLRVPGFGAGRLQRVSRYF